MVLRMAFDEARSQVPPMIIKIRAGNNSDRLLRFEVDDALSRLGIERIDVAQLVFNEVGGPGALVNDFTHGGPLADACRELTRAGKVKQWCPQIDAKAAEAFGPLIEQGTFDGYVLYLNPLQRDVDDARWAQLQARGTPLWALRTVAGASGDPERREQRRTKNPSDPTLGPAERVAPIAEAAGITDWPEFCLRYAASVPHLKSTIGGTGDLGHLRHFLGLAESAKPLPPDVLAAVEAARRG
jgi:aryl-alcohol dehydrogenase-like predicted oxidoreductase